MRFVYHENRGSRTVALVRRTAVAVGTIAVV
jgi:hypothetical protein